MTKSGRLNDRVKLIKGKEDNPEIWQNDNIFWVQITYDEEGLVEKASKIAKLINLV